MKVAQNVLNSYFYRGTKLQIQKNTTVWAVHGEKWPGSTQERDPIQTKGNFQGKVTLFKGWECVQQVKKQDKSVLRKEQHDKGKVAQEGITQPENCKQLRVEHQIAQKKLYRIPECPAQAFMPAYKVVSHHDVKAFGNSLFSNVYTDWKLT